MATYQQRKTGIDPQTGLPTDTVEPTSNVNVNQRSAASPDSSMTGIIIAVVLLLIGAILAFNYGWFDGSDAPNVTQNNTTETVPQATAPDTSSSTSTTVTEPDATTSTTTTTEPSATGTGSTTTTTDP